MLTDYVDIDWRYVSFNPKIFNGRFNWTQNYLHLLELMYAVHQMNLKRLNVDWLKVTVYEELVHSVLFAINFLVDFFFCKKNQEINKTLNWIVGKGGIVGKVGLVFKNIFTAVWSDN